MYLNLHLDLLLMLAVGYLTGRFHARIRYRRNR